MEEKDIFVVEPETEKLLSLLSNLGIKPAAATPDAPPAKKKRTYTEEGRKKMLERMAMMRQKAIESKRAKRAAAAAPAPEPAPEPAPQPAPPPAPAPEPEPQPAPAPAPEPAPEPQPEPPRRHKIVVAGSRKAKEYLISLL